MEYSQLNTEQMPQRRKRYLLFFVWEIIRFIILWRAVANAFIVDQSISTALVLLWISAPGLALIAALYMLWYKDGQEHNPRLHAVTVMAKGFQAILGAASAVLLVRSYGVHPMFFRLEFLAAGITAIVDFFVCLLLLRSGKARSR